MSEHRRRRRLLSQVQCESIRKMIEERAPWLKVTEETVELYRGENVPGHKVCLIDYKDDQIRELFYDFSLKLVTRLVFDEENRLEQSDIPMGVLIRGEEPKAPTNIISFPEKCQLKELHTYDHQTPNIHLHLKCDRLERADMRQLVDALVRITRRTREYAGLK